MDLLREAIAQRIQMLLEGGGGVRTRTSKETTCDFPGGVGGEGEKNKAKKDLVRKLFVLFCKVTGYSLLISGTQPDIYYI